MTERGSAGGEGDEPFSGRVAIGYDHGYDGEIFYLGLALDPAYVEGFVESCLERIAEDDPEGEELRRGEWEEGDGRRAGVRSGDAQGRGGGQDGAACRALIHYRSGSTVPRGRPRRGGASTL